MVRSIDEARTVWQSIDNIVGMERSLRAFWAALVDELDVAGGAGLAFVEGEEHWSWSADEWVCTSGCRTYRLKTSDGDDEHVLKGVVSVPDRAMEDGWGTLRIRMALR